ncbi:hypothetical protein EB796_024188 [Bugula neritina]|uniref:Uncharacterized protein n=1 Tax=Bugula neritina TaxID=10212 RepID=A0A7J7IUH5_BUGNE|nr:hypothetical protein EB796_024188 [Bugula neritina]
MLIAGRCIAYQPLLFHYTLYSIIRGPNYSNYQEVAIIIITHSLLGTRYCILYWFVYFNRHMVMCLSGNLMLVVIVNHNIDILYITCLIL